ncbi:MAG: DUF2088 domain-containing protein [Thermoplasmatales archaeon]|nr:DUF2088 domain-containing protein [Thermoplasmatales archaeon]
MSHIREMLHDIPIPSFLKVKQDINRETVPDCTAKVLSELNRSEITQLIRPGMSIAITSGSRGVDNIACITKTLVEFLQGMGAFPFIIPAMGSHGGSTAEGQRAILTEYGITEEAMGCPVRATMETVKIGTIDESDEPIFIDRYAAEADGIVVVNRVKPHTAFRGTYESGLMKMITIGLGKQKGAEVCHREGILRLGPNMEKFAFAILERANILFGIGTMENSLDQTYDVFALTKSEIPTLEPMYLDKARALMGSIMIPSVDILIVDEIGKDISGEGMDPNISGRWIVPTIKGGINSKIVAVLDLTKETLGNGVGIGMADVCTKKAARKVDVENTYPNSLTSTVTSLCKIPMYFDTDRLTIQAAIQMTWGKKPEEVTIVRIKNTMELGEIYVSENLKEQVSATEGMHIVTEPFSLTFDEQGNWIDR